MTGILALLLFLSQSPSAFDVASVKPNNSPRRGIGNKFGPQRMSWTNTPLSILIQNAFHIQGYQLLGGPDWLNTETWDIEGKTEVPTPRQQQMEMLQTLLADRFQLKFHRETRNLPAFRLVLAKNGPKLQPANEADRDLTRNGRGLIQNPHMTLALLAGFLEGDLGQPVVDGTGLSGSFKIKLEWQPDEDIGLSLFTAIQEQLGLKLESHKAPVEVLIVDRVEKPSAN